MIVASAHFSLFLEEKKNRPILIGDYHGMQEVAKGRKMKREKRKSLCDKAQGTKRHKAGHLPSRNPWSG